MLKFLPLFIFALWMAAAPAARAETKPTRDCVAAPETCLPYTHIGIFAVLIPTQADGRDACMIALIRHGGIYNWPVGVPNADAEILLQFDLDAKVHLNSGRDVLLPFNFPVSGAHHMSPALATAPVDCAVLSHLEIFKATCRLAFKETVKYKLQFDYTSKACIPDLPRRLDFAKTMGSGDIGPGLNR